MGSRCRDGAKGRRATFGPSEIQIFFRKRHVSLCPGPPHAQLEPPPLLGTVQLLQQLSCGNAFRIWSEMELPGSCQIPPDS